MKSFKIVNFKSLLLVQIACIRLFEICELVCKVKARYGQLINEIQVWARNLGLQKQPCGLANKVYKKPTLDLHRIKLGGFRFLGLTLGVLVGEILVVFSFELLALMNALSKLTC
jgi:hypothetical protein